MNSDYQALLAAVLASPKDDAPRLIMADLLDEMGEMERAEFIRVQCELARLHEPELKTFQPILSHFSDVPGGRCTQCAKLPSKCRYHALVDREGELLNELGNWRRLAPDFPLLMTRCTPPQGFTDHAYPTWIRGFIGCVELSAQDCIQHLDRILLQHPIEKVKLTTWPGVLNESGMEYRVVTGSGRAAISRHSLMSEGVRLCLKALWHGIQFELPPTVHDGISPHVLMLRRYLVEHEPAFRDVTRWAIGQGQLTTSWVHLVQVRSAQEAWDSEDDIHPARAMFHRCGVELRPYQVQGMRVNLGVCACGIGWHSEPTFNTSRGSTI